MRRRRDIAVTREVRETRSMNDRVFLLSATHPEGWGTEAMRLENGRRRLLPRTMHPYMMDLRLKLGVAVAFLMTFATIAILWRIG